MPWWQKPFVADLGLPPPGKSEKAVPGCRYIRPLLVKIKIAGGGTTETQWKTVASGLSYIVGIIDYADYQATITE